MNVWSTSCPLAPSSTISSSNIPLLSSFTLHPTSLSLCNFPLHSSFQHKKILPFNYISSITLPPTLHPRNYPPSHPYLHVTVPFNFPTFSFLHFSPQSSVILLSMHWSSLTPSPIFPLLSIPQFPDQFIHQLWVFWWRHKVHYSRRGRHFRPIFSLLPNIIPVLSPRYRSEFRERRRWEEERMDKDENWEHNRMSESVPPETCAM